MTTYTAPTAKLGTAQYTQQLAQQAKALGLSVPSSLSSSPTPPAPSSSILKPGGMETLMGYTPPKIAPPAAGVVPQVYAGSTTTFSGGARDYSAPSSPFTPSTYTPPPSYASSPSPTSSTPAQVYSSGSNPISSAYSALKGYIGSAKSALSSAFGGSSYGGFASPVSAVDSIFKGSQGTSTPTLPTTDSSGATQTVAPTAQTAPSIKDQYSVVTQSKDTDSGTLKKSIDAIKQQEDAQTQAQVQQIQSQLAQKKVELATLMQQQTPETTTGEPAQPYNPEGQANIATLTAQIKSMEDEINRALEGSPEYQAATNALNAKIAEEAAINSRLTQGKTDVAEQPVAYSFISGQQAALQNRANADLQTNAAQQVPLAQRLAVEQAKKSAALDVAKNKYAILSDERGRASDIYRTNFERANAVADRATEQAYKLQLESAKAKATTTTPGASSANITALKNALNASKFQGSEADGKYADPNLYLKNYNSYPDKAEFLRLFPPATYINPANTWLPAEIMKFVKQESRTV